jgi:outer membrane protein assembly factor BamB
MLVISLPRMRFAKGVIVAAVLLAAASIAAADWPQILGPARNGVYSGPALATSWPAAGPRKVWQKRVGQGFAGPVIAGDRLILFHRVANEEIVDALDPGTGELRWHFAYPTAYRDDFGFD